MTPVIQADIRVLQAMAGRFGTLSEQVAAATVVSPVGVVGQATAAAVTAVDTSTATVGTTSAGRMRATAAKVGTGTTKHATQEAESAVALAALTSPPTVAV